MSEVLCENEPFVLCFKKSDRRCFVIAIISNNEAAIGFSSFDQFFRYPFFSPSFFLSTLLFSLSLSFSFLLFPFDSPPFYLFLFYFRADLPLVPFVPFSFVSSSFHSFLFFSFFFLFLSSSSSSHRATKEDYTCKRRTRDDRKIVLTTHKDDREITKASFH